MTLLPILGRELRTQARSRVTYWTRCCVALGGVLICLQSMQTTPMTTPAKVGSAVFDVLVIAAFLVSCSSCLLTADAISAERREGTLGLLFLTEVKAVDVLLGKLGSVCIAGLCALLAFLPALMFPVLAGGVTGGEVLRAGVGLIDTMLLALVIGLCVSAFQHERARAVRRSVAAVVGVVMVPAYFWTGASSGFFHFFGALSPWVLLRAATGAASPRFFWCSFSAILVLAWELLVWTGFRLWRTRGEGSDRDKVERAAPPAEEVRRAVGFVSWQPLKDQSTPVEWLAYRRYGVSAGLWAVGLLGMAYHGWVPLAARPLGGMGTTVSWMFSWPLGTIAGLIGGAVIAWIASRFFVGVRRTGDLELLMTTPVGAESILSDQWKVLQRVFVWPVLVMQAPLLPMILGTTNISGSSSPTAALLPTGLLTLANTFLGATALCWLSLWFGLRARTQAGAIVWAVGLAVGLPALFNLVCSVLFINAAAPLSGGLPLFSPFPLLAGIVSSGFLLWLIWFAKKMLTHELAGVEVKLDQAAWPPFAEVGIHRVVSPNV
jgi:hypothetical protein